jgi:hypothetical protein
LRWRCFAKESKIDSARIRLSIPIRCSHLSGIRLNSKKFVPQRLIAKRSSWPTGANCPSEVSFRLRRHADPDIPILKQAKAEYAKLQ